MSGAGFPRDSDTPTLPSYVPFPACDNPGPGRLGRNLRADPSPLLPMLPAALGISLNPHASRGSRCRGRGGSQSIRLGCRAPRSAWEPRGVGHLSCFPPKGTKKLAARYQDDQSPLLGQSLGGSSLRLCQEPASDRFGRSSREETALGTCSCLAHPSSLRPRLRRGPRVSLNKPDLVQPAAPSLLRPRSRRFLLHGPARLPRAGAEPVRTQPRACSAPAQPDPQSRSRPCASSRAGKAAVLPILQGTQAPKSHLPQAIRITTLVEDQH